MLTDAEVGEGRPLRRACPSGGCCAHENSARDAISGAAQDQRPGDGLPGAELAGEQAALGVPDGRGERRRRRAAGPPSAGAPMPPDCAEAKPTAATRPTPATTQNAVGGRSLPAQHRHHRGRGRQQRDDDRAVAGRSGGERERGQQREADDDAAGRPRPAAPTGPRAGRRCRVRARAQSRRGPRPRPRGRTR